MSGSDSWAGAPTLTGPAGSTTVDNTGFTSETSEPIPTDGPGDGPWQSVWWKWVAPTADPVNFSTQGSRWAGGSGMDTVLAVYTGSSLAGLTQVVANDDYSPFSGLDNFCSRVTFTPVAGTTYYIQASGYDSSEFGDLHLAWDTPTSTTPVWSSPADGTTYTPDSDLTVSFTWSELSQTQYQVVTTGALASDTGVVVDSATSTNIVFPYLTTRGSVTVSVRAKQGTLAWSPFVSITVVIDPDDPTVNMIDNAQDADLGSLELDVTIPAGGIGLGFIVTDTSVTSAPSDWTLHDSGTYGGLTWYRYVLQGAGAGPWTWDVASGGRVTGALEALVLLDGGGDLLAVPVPITTADLVWGAVTGATGDNCTAAGVTLSRTGGAAGMWAGLMNTGDPPPAYAWWTDSGPWFDQLQVFPHFGRGDHQLICSHKFPAFSAETTPTGVASPRLDPAGSVVSIGEANVGWQVGVLGYLLAAAPGRFRLGVVAFS